MGNTGLSTQVTLGEEPAFGTVAAALTRGYEILSEGVEDNVERMESESLRAGKRLQSYWRENRKGAGGDIEYELLNKGFGLIWRNILGAMSGVTTPGGGTISREMTASLGPLNGKSLSAQIGRPDVAGTINPFTYLGGKIAEAELAVEVDGLAKLTTSLDFQNGITPSTPAAKGGPGPALAVAAYPANATPLDWIGVLIQIGGVSEDLNSVTMNVNNNLKDDRFMLRRSSLKKEQLEETSAREITFDLPEEFNGLAAYNRFVNGTEAALTISLRGDLIEGALNYETLITAARVRFDGGTPTAGGADVIEQPATAKLLQPSSGSALDVLLRSTDTAY